MKKKIITFLARKFAAFYWGYAKKEIDDFVIDHQKLRFKFCGENVIFKAGGTIYHPENISIGNHVRVGDNCFIMAIGGVQIGDGTVISRNVCIHSGNHNYKSSTHVPYDKEYTTRNVEIGKAVWIGQNVNILPGVKIGDGAIIAMGTTVIKNVESGQIVGGTGQRIIGERQDEDFEELITKEAYFGKEFPTL